MKAGVDRRTGRKYIEGAPGPEEPRARRNWRTHADAFATHWEQVKRRLEAEPKLMAKTLWEELMREHLGKYSPGQKRSFERRVRQWKERHGQEPVLYFSQEHRPGERMQIDWVDGRRLAVQIAGVQEEFGHKLVHVVLPYSNWEWARVGMSESYMSLKVGVQSALWELGAVPLICQSDNSSTATHILRRGSAERDYNARYLGLLAHYGMKGGLIGIRKPHQNGDVESAHNHLISALEQALLLRSSRWFASLQAYEDFVMDVVRARNLPRQGALEQELLRMRPLPGQRLADYEEQEVTVNRESMVRVGKQAYSVPSRWAGSRLRARISESRIAFYRAEMLVEEVERHSGDSGVYVNWRHVIGQLVRKPGAFARWRHRAAMFPNVQWRIFYDALRERYSEARAEREYLGVLQLACDNGLEKLQSILERLGWGEAGLDAVRRELDVAGKVVVVDFKADLGPYDAMIGDRWQAPCEAEQTQEVSHG